MDNLYDRCSAKIFFFRFIFRFRPKKGILFRKMNCFFSRFYFSAENGKSVFGRSLQPTRWTSTAQETILAACQHPSPASLTSRRQSWHADADLTRMNTSTEWWHLADRTLSTSLLGCCDRHGRTLCQSQWRPLGQIGPHQQPCASDARCPPEYVSWVDLSKLHTG